MLKLLVVDDDRMFAELIRSAMREEGYTVDIATDAAGGRALALVHQYDAVLLDYVLPDGTGLEIAEAIRKQGGQVPILMVTGNDSTNDVVLGLDTGADDYLTKPFEVRELKARVRALVRRGGAARSEELSVAGVSIDRLKHRALVDGRPMDLTPKEFTLLSYLLLHAGTLVTRTDLLEKVWEYTFDPGSNVVDVHVARLRGKLKRAKARARLVTVRGSGFRLTDEARDDDA